MHTAPFHILLAQSHCIFSRGLAAFLAAQIDVETLYRVTDGQSAWRIIRTRRPHIALLDVDLDKLRATEILQCVHAGGIDTRCFIFGTDTDAAVGSAPWRADEPGRLSKDGDFEALMFLLRGFDDQETAGNPSVPSPAPAAAAKSPGAGLLSGVAGKSCA